MFTKSLSTPTRALLAAAVLSVASASASATTYHSSSPDPFASGSAYTVDLQNASHTLISLPGLPFSATDFIISGFTVNSGTDVAGGVDWSYTAHFQAYNGDPTNPANKVGPELTSNNFEALVLGQHSLDAPHTGPLVGTFTEQLLSATFTDLGGSGVSTFLKPGDVPTGSVTIAAAGLLGGYNITPPNLTINAQYTDPNGDTHDTPPLTDVNGTTPSGVPEPATALLMVAGLLGMRRRRAAV